MVTMHKIVLSVWIYTFALMHCNCQTTTMTPAVADVIEGTNVTLVCKVSTAVTFTTWMLNTSSQTPILYNQNGTCIGLNLDDTDTYSYACNTTVFMLTVHKVNRSQHNDMWTCIAASQSSGSHSVIKVKVPIVSVTITPSSSTVDIEENNSQQFTCITSGGRPAGSVSWYKIESGVKSQINQNATETQTTNDNGFIVTTSVLRFVPTREKNGIQIYCEAGNTANSNKVKSSEKQLNVLYKALSPTITEGSEYRVLENVQGQLHCRIEGGNPTPSLTWNCNSWSSSRTIVGETVTQTLSWTTARGPDRTCTCTSQQSGFPIKSDSINVAILYPPSTPTFKVNGNTVSGAIRFIEGKPRSIQCVTESNPTPQIYTWTKDQSSPTYGQNHTFNNVQRFNAGQYSCEVQNTMNLSSGGPITGTNTSSVSLQVLCITEEKSASDIMKISVLVPPAITECKFRYLTEGTPTNAPETLKIITGHSISISCAATGTPRTTLSWKGLLQSKDSSELILRNVNNTNAGQYTFIANSTLIWTHGLTVRRNKSREFQLDTLYPPIIGHLSAMDIEEDTHLSNTCPFIPGIPIKTTAKWTRNIDDRTWNKEVLTIPSVNRNDDANYTCEIYNVMEPTAAPTVSTEVKVTGTFHLNVQYKAVVTSLYVLGFETNTDVTTVNETYPLQFKCTAISNPLPTIQIRKGDNTLNSSVGNMNLLYSVGNAMCLDAGTYTCFGSNKFNKEEASKQLQVNVNCSPRFADTVNLNRTSEKNETYTFMFNAIAYPVPVFIWKKWVGDVWEDMQDGDNVRITSSDLQYNLTIHRVGQGDFGKYLLVVTNDFGEMEFHYQLQPDDDPDAPTDFRHVEHMATESSIQLEWKPGFNGGPSQTFYIKYKKSSSSTWNDVSVIDTGKETMRYMLTGLEIDTQYHVIIYSSNRKGNSSISEPLIAKTKAIVTDPSIGPVVGGAVGGGVGCVILVIIAIFVLRRYRFSTGIPNSGAETTTRNQNETNKSSDDAGYYNIGREVQVASQSTSEPTYYNDGSIPDYEMLNQQNRDFTTYSSLQPNSNSLTNDNSSGENKTYENLQLHVM